MSKPGARLPLGAGLWLAGVLFLSAVPSGADAAPKEEDGTIRNALNEIRESEAAIVEAERIASSIQGASAEQLAKRVVKGQLALGERDLDGAAMIFLDVLENHPRTPAASQSLYFLGEALAAMDMNRWASECFLGNLRDASTDGKRFHQQSLAALFDLAAPRRESGFARKPGPAATPEIRARLKAAGLDVTRNPPEGVVSNDDLEQLVKWVESIGSEKREVRLRYAFARWLFLRDKTVKARTELEALAPRETALKRGTANDIWYLRASYVAAAAAISAGESDEGVERFERIVEIRPLNDAERQIVDLANLGIARVHYDHKEYKTALDAYRKIGRDSPFFAEAMYEAAWALLREGRHERAVQALDLLMSYEPEGPLVPEIKALRGKIKIKEKNWNGAEAEFIALKEEFKRVSQQVGRSLKAYEGANDYFTAVVSEQMSFFSLEVVMPRRAVPIAKGLPRVVQGAGVAREVGELDRELTEIRALLTRMEEAVDAPERARLFTDLSAQLAAVDSAYADMVAVQEDLVRRASQGLGGGGLAKLEAERQRLQQAMGEGVGSDRIDIEKALRENKKTLHQYDLAVAALRAQLVAVERYYEATQDGQKIDSNAFLSQAAELRNAIHTMENDVRRLEAEVVRLQTVLRFDDPWLVDRRRATREYSKFLSKMWGTLMEARNDAQADEVFKRVEALSNRVVRTREALDAAAGRRLTRAIIILEEERANLDRYRAELDQKRGETTEFIGQLMAAGYRDVQRELDNMVMRAEVGLLDVAWAIQEVEAEEIRRLESARDRDLRQIDEVLNLGLGEVK